MSARDRLPARLRRASLRDLLLIGIPALLLVIAAFWVTARFVKPAPPSALVIATDESGTAYERFGAAYKPVLARYGIDLRSRATGGAVENLELLSKGEVDAAFLQGGIAQPQDDDELFSLGGLCYEPLWIFYRASIAGHPLDEVGQLKGRRIAVDDAHSGTRTLAMEILHANGMDRGPTQLNNAGGLAAVAALNAGTVDAVFVVGVMQSAAVWSLLYSPGVRLMNLSQADAYVRMFPYLTRVTLPRGAVDLAGNIPAGDVALLAPTTTLAVRRGIHPALVELLLEAASEVHGTPDIFHHAGEFPRAQGIDFPLAPEAERYYKSGKPLLQRYLPFWAAILIDRMVVMLIPLFAVLFPVFRFAPMIYGWRVRSRIYRRYGELKFLEAEIDRQPDLSHAGEWFKRLDAIEHDVHRIPAPLAYADMLYTLRSHIDLVRASLQKKAGAGAAKET